MRIARFGVPFRRLCPILDRIAKRLS